MPVLEEWTYYVWSFFTLAYFAIFVVAWEFDFPTTVEANLWRAASVCTFSSGLVTGIFIHFGFRWKPGFFTKVFSWAKHKEDAEAAEVEGGQTPDFIVAGGQDFLSWGSRTMNNSLLKDPSYDVLAEVLATLWFCGPAYVVSRYYVIVADFLELRLLPVSAFQQIERSLYVPRL